MKTNPTLYKTRTDEQRMADLVKANRVKQALAAVKRELAAGELSISEVLAQADDDPDIAMLRTRDAIKALPNMGPKRTERAMEDLRIAWTTRLRGLGPRQRKRLVRRFG